MKEFWKYFKSKFNEVFGEFINWGNLILLILLAAGSYFSELYTDQIWVLVISLTGTFSGLWLIVRIIIQAKRACINIIKNKVNNYEKQRKTTLDFKK